MLQFAKRVQRLEAQLSDGTGLRTHSPDWQAHWERKLALIVSGEEPGEPGSIPLEIWDAIGD